MFKVVTMSITLAQHNTIIFIVLHYNLSSVATVAELSYVARCGRAKGSYVELSAVASVAGLSSAARVVELSSVANMAELKAHMLSYQLWLGLYSYQLWLVWQVYHL